MLTIIPSRTSRTDTNILMELSIVASSDSPGILDFSVIANDGTNVLGPIPVGCGRNIFRSGIMIARDKLPVFVLASECGSDGPNSRGPVSSTSPLFGEDRPTNQMRVICPPMATSGSGWVPAVNNQACIDEQNRIQHLRNEILTMCGEASAIQGRRDAFAAAAAAMFLLAGALAVGAATTAIPWVIGLLLVAAMVIFLIGGVLTLLAGIQQNDLDRKRAEIDDARRRYTSSVEHLSDVCCAEFMTVPLDVPACP